MKLLKQNFLFAIVAITLFAMAFTSGAFAIGNGLGEPGTMLEFVNSDQSAQPPTLNVTTNFTIEGWFNATTFPNPGNKKAFYVYSDGNGAAGSYFALGFNDVGQLEFRMQKNASPTDILNSGAVNINTGECNHIAVVANGTTHLLTMYVNGAFVNQIALTNTVDPVALNGLAENRIGGDGTSPASYSVHGYGRLIGSVDELRLWSSDRTLDIAANFNKAIPAPPGALPGDIFAYYDFNSAPGGNTIPDLTSNSYDLVLIGSPVASLVTSCADVYTDVPAAFCGLAPGIVYTDALTAAEVVTITGPGNDVVLTWNLPATNFNFPNPPSADYFNVFVSTTSAVAGFSQVGGDLTAATYTLTGTTPATEYWYYIKAVNPVGEMLSCGPYHFVTSPVNASPGAFALVAPANGAVDVDGCSSGYCVDFSWDPASNMQTANPPLWAAGTYTLEVATDNAFGNIVGTVVVDNPTVTAQVCGLTPSTDYYWRVTADNSFFPSTTSSTFMFTTAPDLPDLIAPLNGAIGQVTNPHLSWIEITGAGITDVVYDVYVDTDPAFGTPDIYNTTAAVQILNNLDFATIYYWRVTATYNLNGVATTRCSEIWNFKTGIAWNNAGAISTGNILWDLVECPEGSGIMYAATWGGGVFRSDDAVNNYQDWVQVGHQGGLNTMFIWDLLCYNNGVDDILFASTEAGIYFTLDGGISWSQMGTTGLPVGATDIRSMAIFNDGANDYMVIGTWGYGVYYRQLGVAVNWIAANPNGITPNAAVQEVVINDGYLFAGTADHGIYRISLTDLLAAPNILNGFKHLNNMPYSFIWALEGGEGNYHNNGQAGSFGLYAGTYGDGFWRSVRDDINTTVLGDLWTQENTGLDNNYVHALFHLDGTPGPATLYAGTWPGGVFMATDEFANNIVWEDLGLTQFVSNSDGSGLNVSSIFKAGGKLLVGTDDGHLYVASAPQGPTSVGNDDNQTQNVIPSTFEVSQNYPNPFNPSTTIKYGLPENSIVTIKIFNILGQEVKTLVNTEKNAGTYSVTWNGDNNFGQKVTSGTYIYRVVAGNFVQTKKMVLLK